MPTLSGPELERIEQGYSQRPGCYVPTDITRYTLSACTAGGGGTQWNASVANASLTTPDGGSTVPVHFCYLPNANQTGIDRIRQAYLASNMGNLQCRTATSAGAASGSALRIPALSVSVIVMGLLVVPFHLLAM
jgi:hypothetical protein